MYKKELFANVRGCFCDHNTGLAKIAMIVIVKNATVQIKKKGNEKQKSKCPENLALNKKSIKILLIFMPRSYLFAGNRGKRRVRKIVMQK
jgi:hypothetical protein